MYIFSFNLLFLLFRNRGPFLKGILTQLGYLRSFAYLLFSIECSYRQIKVAYSRKTDLASLDFRKLYQRALLVKTKQVFSLPRIDEIVLGKYCKPTFHYPSVQTKLVTK